MRRYLLLRKSQESGPYSLEEIINKKLTKTDMVKDLESSEGWESAIDSDALAFYVQQDKNSKNKTESFSYKCFAGAGFQPPLKHEFQLTALFNLSVAKSSSENVASSSIGSEKFRDAADKEQYKKQSLSGKAACIAAIFTGLSICFYLFTSLMKAINKFAFKNIVSSAALKSEPKENEAYYQHALTRDLIPVGTSLTNLSKKTKKLKLIEQVLVDAHLYKMIEFKGIDFLKINVNNRSAHVLDKVDVEVAYLKKNGDIYRKEAYHLRSVAPRSIKTMDVPPFSKGLKIKCRIISIKSHLYKPAMIEI